MKGRIFLVNNKVCEFPGPPGLAPQPLTDQRTYIQEDPLTRFLLRYDEFETGAELRDGKGAPRKNPPRRSLSEKPEEKVASRERSPVE